MAEGNKGRERWGLVPTSPGYQLAEKLGEQLRQRGYKLACAESCTGGLLSGQIVAVPGSSDYYLGAVVAYDNAVKAGVLGVAQATLEAHGAVSWQTAVEMARGALHVLGADVALSTTGIAGPTGGSIAKPVGLVYIGLATKERAWWERQRWSGSRAENNMETVFAALSLLERYLQDKMALPSTERPDDHGSVIWETQSEGGAQETIIMVEATRDREGAWIPRAFQWQGQRYEVSSHGRSWQEEGRRHYLVMSEPRGTFELAYDPAQERWSLLRHWLRPQWA